MEKYEKVGEIEDERIKLSTIRKESAHGKTIDLSDMKQIEMDYLNTAILESRRAFENKDFNHDQKMFDKTRHGQESSKSLDEQFETQMKSAIQQSIVDNEKQLQEKQDIERAIKQSMKIDKTRNYNANNGNDDKNSIGSDAAFRNNKQQQQ